MPRIPKDASIEVQRSMRELWQEIDSLKRASITDMHGRRLSNTGNPKQRRDYANKGYIDDIISKFRSDVEKDIKRLKKLRPASEGGTTLPPTSTDFGFGYWYVDTIHALGGGQWENEVKGYTNSAFVFDRDGGDSDVGPVDRAANIAAIVNRLATAGFQIWLDVGPNAFLQPDQMIQAAQPHWDKVKYVLLGDEPAFGSVQAANALIDSVRILITDAGLSQKPIGCTFTYEQVTQTDIVDANWDFVNLEAYTIPCVPGGCGASTPEAEIAAVKGRMDQQKARVAATKFLMIVMQGYDRNGSFDDIQVLAALNAATYFEMSKGDARVKGINIFAYGRPNSPGTPGGGSQQNPELKVEHQKIWADLTGGTGTTSSKKCVGDTRPCPGAPTCCDGGLSNPCNCPRLCEGGTYAPAVGQATTAMVQAHPELFIPGTTTFLGIAEALQFRGYITVNLNTVNPTLEAGDDPNDGKQVLVRQRVAPQFREDYAVWATDLTPRYPPGSYRASCWPGTF